MLDTGQEMFSREERNSSKSGENQRNLFGVKFTILKKSKGKLKQLNTVD